MKEEEREVTKYSLYVCEVLETAGFHFYAAL